MITIAPMTSLALKSRLGLLGWALPWDVVSDLPNLRNLRRPPLERCIVFRVQVDGLTVVASRQEVEEPAGSVDAGMARHRWAGADHTPGNAS